MAQIPLLDELALIAGLGVLITLVLARLRLPTIAGLLLSGALLGPFGLGLIRSTHSIEVLAEIGVVLLLFTIGLEFSVSRLSHIFRQVAVGGALQVVLTVGAVAGFAALAGAAPGHAIFYGFLFALSSTAIVLRALGERGELDAPHGRFIVGTLIFQDLCVVPMVLIVPLLASDAPPGELLVETGVALVKAGGMVVLTIVGARYLVPKLLGWVDASRSREVFLLAVLALCLGTAWLTAQAGLSLALGAFLGGMVVADTEYGHRAMGDMLPLRDTFVSIFFVSLGMLFDPRVVLESPAFVAVLLLGFLVGKGMLATVAAMAMRFPARVAWLAGVGLAQFGEFGFVLARLGESSGIVSGQEMRPLLAAGILSMFLTPLLVRAAPHITAGERLLAPLERLLGARGIDQRAEDGQSGLHDHVILVGYGLAGRLTAAALERSGIPFVVLEVNADTVRLARQSGAPVFYADATSEEALRHAHLDRARAMVLLMNDPIAAQRIVDTARRVAPGVSVLMRTRYLTERPRLLAMGARDVVAEEVEGGLEVIVRLLRWLEVPRNHIDARIEEAREVAQTSQRTITVPRPQVGDQHLLADMRIEIVQIPPQGPSVGRSPLELDLRRATGALIVGVRRHQHLRESPDPNDPFEPGDIVYLAGTREAVRRAMDLLVGASRRDT